MDHPDIHLYATLGFPMLQTRNRSTPVLRWVRGFLCIPQRSGLVAMNAVAFREEDPGKVNRRIRGKGRMGSTCT